MRVFIRVSEDLIRVLIQNPSRREPTKACEGLRRSGSTAEKSQAREEIFGSFRTLELNRGAQIRTGDLTDPNGARYQAAPRPEATEYGKGRRLGPARPSACNRLEVPDREPGHERLEALFEGQPLALRVNLEAL
jgi:hypothetical protein